MRARISLIALFVLFVPGVVVPALAQTAATISGTVEDEPQRSRRRNTHGAERRHGADAYGRHRCRRKIVIAGLPPGTYELRAELPNFRPHVRREIPLTVAQALVLNITLEVGGLSEEVMVVGDTSVINTSSGELSYLVGSQAIEQLPLNGRNYTDLALLQPGVACLPAPRRRLGGRARPRHERERTGLPRSNVYLLDGTLQNDFTNGPAGSAAGTALGMDTIREFRVEINAYSAEFGRNFGGQINVLTKSGTNTRRAAACSSSTATTRSTRATTSTSPSKPDFHAQPVRRRARRSDAARTASSSSPATKALIERLGRTISTFVPDDNARRGILPDGHGRRSTPRSALPRRIPRANGPSLGGGLAPHTFPFNQTLDRALRAGPDRLPGRRAAHQFFARYTFDDADAAAADGLPAVPALVHLDATSSSPRNTATSARTARCKRRAFGYSRTRIGQNVEANLAPPLPPFVAGRGIVGDIDIGGMQRFGPQSSANLRLAQNVFSGQDDIDAHARPTPAEGGRAGRALPGHHGQPDVQPRDLYLRRTRAFLENRADAASSASPEATVRSLLARHALRLLRPGRHPARAADLGQRGAAIRVHDAAEGEVRPRLVAADLTASARRHRAALPEPDYTNLSPRAASPGMCSATAEPRCAAATGCTSTPTTIRT